MRTLLQKIGSILACYLVVVNIGANEVGWGREMGFMYLLCLYRIFQIFVPDVGVKHLDSYLGELVRRLNNRKNPYLLGDTLLKLIQAENLPYQSPVESAY